MRQAIFGDEGRREDHASLCASFVFKIHIKLPDEEPWLAKIPVAARKNNSYLVYTHVFFTVLIDRAEDFQNS
ncbi:type II toxin-antitoxin system YafO family toxin [Xenorhabdus hominickii]|uniref:type II toxin-antitoxin system YafO family toxin n=1 Tax=Xenorhabdus hominickii TaxID=351679 RepID=UPI000903A3EA|nr:type II toxin-antitoxin system YafO family toxin [Xenorhabdus hominickii]